MDSLLPCLNEISTYPSSPAEDFVELEDLPFSDSGFFETPNPSTISDREPNPIPDLNLSPPHTQVGRKELSDTERSLVYASLLERSKSEKLYRGVTREVSEMFGLTIRCVQRIWKRGRESGNHNPGKFRVQNCGRKKVQFDLEMMRDIPLRNRTSLRALSCALGVSRSFLVSKLKEGVIWRHTNAIRPSIIEENVLARLNHCLSHFDPATVSSQPTFKAMENIVHIDEKWFYLTRKTQNYYLLPDESDPVRIIKNANCIPKVMFLAAVARSRYDSNGDCTFDGKIGVFPLVEHVAAVRSSQNRPRDTIEVKPIAHITRNIMREFMINKIIPVIANKWPRDSIRAPIFIQQDNTKSHILSDDVDFLCALNEIGMDFVLLCQPPNSPDLNVLDLGFFRAIQSLQVRECATSVVELIDAYLQFSVHKNNCIFLTLQSCMVEIIKCLGSNRYNIPHMKMKQLARLGLLPTTLQCCLVIYARFIAHVSETLSNGISEL